MKAVSTLPVSVNYVTLPTPDEFIIYDFQYVPEFLLSGEIKL